MKMNKKKLLNQKEMVEEPSVFTIWSNQWNLLTNKVTKKSVNVNKIPKEMLLAARFKLKILFRKALIIPEPHEYFISMDNMNHLIKVKFLDKEL